MLEKDNKKKDENNGNIEIKEKDDKNNENNDNELKPNEETNAMQALQISYENKIKEIKEHYENKIGLMKEEHVKQIRNILLGRNVIDDEENEKSDDEKMIENIKNNINKYRR